MGEYARQYILDTHGVDIDAALAEQQGGAE